MQIKIFAISKVIDFKDINRSKTEISGAKLSEDKGR